MTGMNRTRKILCVLLCIVFCMTMASGCGKDADSHTISASAGNDTPGNTETLDDSIYIMLYMLNEDSWETEIDADTEDADDELTTTVVAEISEKDLNAETIVAKYNEIVVQSMYGELFSVNSVAELDQKVMVDFDSESVKSVGIAEGEEGPLFYNLARSIDENLGDVNAIYFTMDGGNDFRLGHLWFAAEDPFYSGRGPVE